MCYILYNYEKILGLLPQQIPALPFDYYFAIRLHILQQIQYIINCIKG